MRRMSPKSLEGPIRIAQLSGADTGGTSRIVVDESRQVIVGATFTGFETADFLHAATIAIVAIAIMAVATIVASRERLEPVGAEGVERDRRAVTLAQVLDAIRNANINVQEMENIIFEGSEAAVARINLEAAPSNETLERLRTENPDILELSLLEIRT